LFFLGEGKVAKRTVALIVAGAILWVSATAAAQVYSENGSGWDLTDDLTISDGDYYWYVDADEASVIDIVGGEVEELLTFAFSSADIAGGLTQKLEALEASTINVSGGEIWDLSAYDQSQISITGGEVGWLYSYNPNFEYDGTREVWEGLLTGYWENEVPFNITTWDESTYDQMVLYDLGPPPLPEPGTLLLLGLGALAIRKRR
jgi:hypothetical protein